MPVTLNQSPVVVQVGINAIYSSYNYAADTGSVNAIVIPVSAPPAAYAEGIVWFTKFAHTNTSQTVTAKIGNLAALPVVVDQSGTLPFIGAIEANMFGMLCYSAAQAKLILLNPSTVRTSVNVALYGAVGDGVTDDTAAIQAAVTAAAANNWILEFIHEKNYLISSNITVPSNSYIKGNGATINQTGITSGNKWAFAAQGSLNGSVKQNLSADATVGSYTVTLSSTTGFNAGDYILIGSADYYPVGGGSLAGYNVNRGEVLQIRSIVANTSITFCTPLLDTYTAANTAFVQEITWLTDIYIDGLFFQGSNTAGHSERGLVLEYVRNFGVTNCKFLQQDTYQLEVGGCIHGNVSENYFNGVFYDGVHGTIFYGCVFLNTSQWINFLGNEGHTNRHLVVSTGFSTGQGFYGQPRFLNWEGNHMYDDEAASGGSSGASYAYEIHGFGEYINILGNTADGCYAGIQFENGAHIVAMGNTIRNYGSAGILFGAAGAVFSDILIYGNPVSHYTGDFTTTPGGFRLEVSSSVTPLFKNVKIVNNNFSECYNATAGFGQGGVVQSVTAIAITGNTHSNTTIDSISPNTTGLAVGMGISGTGIPLGATIQTITSSSAITISNAATSTNTGVSISVTPVVFSNVVISDNEFDSGVTNVNLYCISLNLLDDYIKFNKNTMVGFQSGINLSTSSNCKAQGNTVMLVGLTTNIPATGFGIYTNGSRNFIDGNEFRFINTGVRVDTSGYKNVVTNNFGSQISTMVSDGGTGTVTTSGNNLVAG